MHFVEGRQQRHAPAIRRFAIGQQSIQALVFETLALVARLALVDPLPQQHQVAEAVDQQASEAAPSRPARPVSW
jgi:hypothetical protein